MTILLLFFLTFMTLMSQAMTLFFKQESKEIAIELCQRKVCPICNKKGAITSWLHYLVHKKCKKLMNTIMQDVYALAKKTNSALADTIVAIVFEVLIDLCGPTNNIKDMSQLWGKKTLRIYCKTIVPLAIKYKERIREIEKHSKESLALLG